MTPAWVYTREEPHEYPPRDGTNSDSGLVLCLTEFDGWRWLKRSWLTGGWYTEDVDSARMDAPICWIEIPMPDRDKVVS